MKKRGTCARWGIYRGIYIFARSLKSEYPAVFQSPERQRWVVNFGRDEENLCLFVFIRGSILSMFSGAKKIMKKSV